jgi:hypothetical protein
MEKRGGRPREARRTSDESTSFGLGPLTPFSSTPGRDYEARDGHPSTVAEPTGKENGNGDLLEMREVVVIHIMMACCRERGKCSRDHKRYREWRQHRRRRRERRRLQQANVKSPEDRRPHHQPRKIGFRPDNQSLRCQRGTRRNLGEHPYRQTNLSHGSGIPDARRS